MTPGDVVRLVKDAGVKFWDDFGPRLGAAQAYYIALALSPLLLAVIAIAGLVFDEGAARAGIVDQFRNTLGKQAATVVEDVLANSTSKSNSIFATIVAGVVLFIGASGVFAELQSALNSIWKVPGKESKGGILTMVKDRLISFSLVAGSAFLLLVSLALTALLAGLNKTIEGWMPQLDFVAQVINFVLNFLLTAALFAMIFKWLPETKLSWHDVWIGSMVTSGLFSIGRYLIGLYLGQAAIGSAYGAAGAFVVLLVWIYYSTQILLFGAELTFVYAQRFGSGVRTAEGRLVEPRAATTPDLAPAAVS